MTCTPKPYDAEALQTVTTTDDQILDLGELLVDCAETTP
jgi:hypothetical protein